MAAPVGLGAAPDGRLVLDRLHELPGGPQLIELAARRDDVELVGGAVRDLLIGRQPRELDVVVADSAEVFAEQIAAAVGARSVEGHERFGTAVVRWAGGQIDVARRRSESYAHPGALPDTHPGTTEQDLTRRDFTVNAIAVPLAGSEHGRLRYADGALDDLAAHQLRVLHPRSFIDDPTRLLRLARYRARLGFELEEGTARLASEAIAADALQTVSPARIGAELRLALDEPDPVAALASLQQLGALPALHETLVFDRQVVLTALSVLPECDDASSQVLLLASLLLPRRDYDATDYQTRLRVLLDEWEFPAVERERTVRSVLLAPRIAERLGVAERASQIYEVAHQEPLEAIALAAALAERRGQQAAADAARRWLANLRHEQLEIGGDDLLAAGVAAGPEVGRRLRQALLRKLDCELDGREAELRAALEDR
ncbi:MAG TPA: hypothetical protein VGF47_05960 [Solirubrobacteraceae bacterium]